MTVRLRFARGGRKKLPFYHVVAADSRDARDGRFLERLGYYNPNVKENRLHWDSERVNYWLGVGAQPSEVVSKLLLSEGLGTEKQRAKWENALKIRREAVEKRLAAEKAAKEAEEKAAAPSEDIPAEEAAAEESKDAAPAEKEAPAKKEAASAAEEVKADTPAEKAPAEEKPAEAAAEEKAAE